jgi:hypothetical protein
VNIHQYCATAALLLSLLPANASQVIYKSVGHQTLTGNGKITRITTKGFLVLQFGSNGNASAISAFTLNGQKLFTIVPLQNYSWVQVTGPNGAIYDVFAKAENPGTQFATTILESVFHQGKESLVIIDPSGPTALPRTFSSVGQNIFHNVSTGITLAGTAASTEFLDVKGSLTSNNAGESFDAAVARLSAIFVAAGYTQLNAPL